MHAALAFAILIAAQVEIGPVLPKGEPTVAELIKSFLAGKEDAAKKLRVRSGPRSAPFPPPARGARRSWRRRTRRSRRSFRR